MTTGEFDVVGGLEGQFFGLGIKTGDQIYDPGGDCMICGPSTYRWNPQTYTTVRAVPEPGSAVLWLAGLGVLLAAMRRRGWRTGPEHRLLPA
jgi:hypothetical protein